MHKKKYIDCGTCNDVFRPVFSDHHTPIQMATTVVPGHGEKESRRILGIFHEDGEGTVLEQVVSMKRKKGSYQKNFRTMADAFKRWWKKDPKKRSGGGYSVEEKLQRPNTPRSANKLYFFLYRFCPGGKSTGSRIV